MEQQNQNVQVEEGISLMDIIRLLLTKIKLLILVVLIGGIAGGMFAVWRTIDINYYGTKVEFYVNPEKPEESKGTSSGTAAGGSQYGVYGAYGRHVMDNIVKLLGSDSFAEKLILNGSELPKKDILLSSNETIVIDGEKKSLNEVLNQAIDVAAPYVLAIEECEENYNNALSAKAKAVTAYNKADTDLDNEWRLLFQQGLVKKATFNEEEFFSLPTPPAALADAYSKFVAAQNDVTKKTLDADNAEEAWKTAKREAQEPVETALEYWRMSSNYSTELKFYKDAVSFDYLESDEDFEDANNLARSFIYVTISIQHSNHEEGMAIANKILDRVKTVVPDYISENMTVPDGYSGTNCQRITRTDDIHLTNPGYTRTEAIKYAFLVAAASAVVAAVIIIILDRSDKRLRDTEMVVRKFNVPLLGIVPTIDELSEESQAKKTANKTTEVK